MKNALVIDFEYWHSPELLRGHVQAEPLIDQCFDSVAPILELLDRYRMQATFAVLGDVAEKHPDIIEDIYSRGHEIASHAWSHRLLYDLTKDEFEYEIKRSVEVIESITGERPIGFRAPSFSINNSTLWAFDILEKYKFQYDASVFPVKTMLYGVPNAPLDIYRPSKDDIAKNDPNGKIIEFPMTVLKIGKKIPIGGGFYLRILPFWFIKYGIKRVNRERPAIIYIHPWETFSHTPRQKLPMISRIITYNGIDSALNKLEGLLRIFDFTSIKDILIDY